MPFGIAAPFITCKIARWRFVRKLVAFVWKLLTLFCSSHIWYQPLTEKRNSVLGSKNLCFSSSGCNLCCLNVISKIRKWNKNEYRRVCRTVTIIRRYILQISIHSHSANLRAIGYPRIPKNVCIYSKTYYAYFFANRFNISCTGFSCANATIAAPDNWLLLRRCKYESNSILSHIRLIIHYVIVF